MLRHYSILLAVFGLAAGELCLMPSPAPGGDKKSPARALSDKALSAAERSQRVAAALDLSMLAGPDVSAQLRRIAFESKEPEVIVPALSGLMIRSDGGSLPFFVAALEQPNLPIRQVGIQGVLKVTGLAADQVRFKADDPPEERGKAVRRLRELLDKGNAKSPP